MKQSAIFLAVFLSLAAAASAGTHFDVYLIAGQSNMDGRGRVSDLTNDLARWRQPQSQVRIFYANPINKDAAHPSYNSGWQTLQPGFSVPPRFKSPLPSACFGPELAFAHTLAQAHPDRHLALIKVTQGGTSLSRNWNPATGYMYASFTNTVPAALRALQTEGNTYTLKGMIWHQGESDESSGARYEAMLAEFIKAVRRDLGAAQLPFVLGEIATNKSSLFRQAQRELPRKLPAVGFVSADGLHTFEAPISSPPTSWNSATASPPPSRLQPLVLRLPTNTP